MVHVIKPLTVKTANDVHYIAKYDGPVKSSRLGLLLTSGLNFGQFSLIYIKLVYVVESLLICINATKYVNLVAAYYC